MNKTDEDAAEVSEDSSNRSSHPLPQLRRHNNCTECELHEEANHVGIPTIFLKGSLTPSPSTPAVLLLGQNPGFNEDKEGLPFVGPSGQLVKSVYIDGISLRTLASVYLGNVARCYTPTMDGPKAKHYRACIPYLEEDLCQISQTSSSITILTLGAPAATWLYKRLADEKMNLTKAFQQQGRCLAFKRLSNSPIAIEASTVSFNVYSTYHPAAVLRVHNLIYAVQDHMQLLLDHLTGNSPGRSTPKIVSSCSPQQFYARTDP